LVDVLHLSADEPTEGENLRRQPGSPSPQSQREACIEVGKEARQENVQNDGVANHLGHRQPVEGKVQRIKEPCLRVGQERHTHEEIGIPQRQMTLAYNFSSVSLVRVEVSEHVQPHQDEISERDFPEEA
jgi:hypothetical protein